MGGEPPPGYSSGGMRTKLVAARIATQAGCAMAIAFGHADRPLRALEEGARCTWFLPAPEGRSARKRWIAGALAPLGALAVDAGAARALAAGRSLLPAGVRGVEGSSSAATRWWCAARTARRWRAAYPPMPAPMPPHRRPPLRRDRGDPRLARPRRDDPPRRSRAAVMRRDPHAQAPDVGEAPPAHAGQERERNGCTSTPTATQHLTRRRGGAGRRRSASPRMPEAARNAALPRQAAALRAQASDILAANAARSRGDAPAPPHSATG